jgi:hypothetical protein
MIDKSEAQKNDLQRENLKGKVKKIKEVYFDAFDSLGKVIKGRILGRTEILYNKNGFRIEDTYFNSKQNLKGILQEKIIYKYTDSGWTIDKKDFKLNGNLDEEIIDKFDNKGKQIEHNGNKIDSSWGSNFGNKYDDKGNVIELYHYQSDSSIWVNSTFKYDDKGNQIEGNYTNSDGSIQKYLYKYDELNNIIEEDTYGIDGKRYLTTDKYEYDSKGNWIKNVECAVWRNNDITITEREIIYY